MRPYLLREGERIYFVEAEDHDQAADVVLREYGTTVGRHTFEVYELGVAQLVDVTVNINREEP